MARHLRPVEAAAALLRLGLVEAGFTSPKSQVDVVLAVLRARFARATIEDDRLVTEVLRVFGRPESEIWAVLQEWAVESGRDAGEVFEHCWAPDLDEEER